MTGDDRRSFAAPGAAGAAARCYDLAMRSTQAIAVGANGTLYVSTDGGGGTNVQALIAIDPRGEVTALASDPRG
jgi:hypothetical protein